jgi:hypothetical protein
VHRPPKYLELTTIWNKRDPADPHLRSASHKADPIGCSPSTVTGNFLSVTQEYQPGRDTLDSLNASLVHFYLKLVISFITRGDNTWQESLQCMTESRLPVQTCRLSVVRDVQRHPDMLSVRRERRAAFCGQQKLAYKYTTIQSHLSSQFYDQPAEIPLFAYLSLRLGNPHLIW